MSFLKKVTREAERIGRKVAAETNRQVEKVNEITSGIKNAAELKEKVDSFEERLETLRMKQENTINALIARENLANKSNNTDSTGMSRWLEDCPIFPDLGGPKFLLDELGTLSEVGEGSQGTVFKCRKGAVKIFANDVPIYEIKRELELAPIFSKLHSSFVQFRGYVYLNEESRDMHFVMGYVMEFIEESLYRVIFTKEDLQFKYSYSLSTVLVWSCRLAEGLLELHEASFLHRDLKPANILVDFHSSTPIAKIADFGKCRNYSDSMTSRVGTIGYLPHEMREKHGYDFSVDVYSLGVTVAEMLTRRKYEDLVAEFKTKDIRTFVDPQIPMELLDILQTKVLCDDPEFRFTMREFYEWISNYSAGLPEDIGQLLIE